ncbi:aminotransferase class I/II-fold pyridoxal phosphate-dependent enzyme [Xylophilus sp. ASV27]|uniref:aminotransferase class I/II-fold pyridoxal phosphate-dependent enzyme n=1 Tax=Xylophilus sp. ASV27 TaxID=2795129 RepID=UPI0018ED2972|nr:aminotransferase class I/II-fold pyridoxal phosphate-dependent enzyme [Xylophilus sp. ASV27]
MVAVSGAALPRRAHGGPDAAGAAPFDFSTNANACGPCPQALARVQAADATRYPDPAYQALRERLAARHGVAPARIVLAASASEAIFRLTARAAQRGLRRVALPAHAYGDYAHAAQAWGLDVEPGPGEGAVLRWQCDPSSPLGQPDPPGPGGLRVLDRAYAPLRLSGADPWSRAALEPVWQLWSPNKALGLTGVRAAYLVAPEGGGGEAAALERLAPSWPLGAHGVALLQAWCEPAVAAWLAQSLATLRSWKAQQQALCTGFGWTCLPSEANFFCARVPGGGTAPLLRRLRRAGVRLRDAASFGLPGHVRLGVLPPQGQAALAAALRAEGAP